MRPFAARFRGPNWRAPLFKGRIQHHRGVHGLPSPATLTSHHENRPARPGAVLGRSLGVDRSVYCPNLHAVKCTTLVDGVVGSGLGGGGEWVVVTSYQPVRWLRLVVGVENDFCAWWCCCEGV